MPPRSTSCEKLWLALAAGLSLGVTGCSMDDVELNGGLFDAVGLNDAKKVR